MSVANFEVVDQRTDQPGPGHAERVAQRDGATVGVELPVNAGADVAGDRDDLRGEGFVEFHGIDVLDGGTGGGEYPLDGLDRADAHVLGGQRGYRGGEDAGARS